MPQRNKDSQEIDFSQVDWKSEKSIVGWVQHMWQTRDRRRLALERQWDINCAMYSGYQNLTWDRSSRRLREEQVPSWRVRFVANLLQGIVLKRISKLLRMKPQWTCLPATLEPEDELANTAANRALRYYWRFLHMNKKLINAGLWLFTTGNVFLHPCWDAGKSAGIDIYPEDATAGPYGEPEGDAGLIAQGTQMLRSLFSGKKQGAIPANIGDMEYEIVPPYELDLDPGATLAEDAAFAIHSKARSLSYIRDRYGKVADGLEQDASEEGSEGDFKRYETRIRHLFGPSSIGTSEGGENLYIVHEVWVKPFGEHSKGIHCAVSGSRLLKKPEDLPYGLKEIPYAHAMDIPVPGRLWGTSVLEQCIPAQMDYNKRRSQMLENANLMSRPKWLVPRGASIMSSALTSEPGELVEYNFGFKPEAWKPDSLGSDYPKLIEFDRRDIEDISAQHEVSHGKNPSGVRTAAGIAQLQEQDDTMLAPTGTLLEDALGKTGSWLLQIAAVKVTEQRLLKIVGVDHAIEVAQFKGSDLIGQSKGPGVNFFDVEVSLGSQLPASKAARSEIIDKWIQMGLLNVERDNQEIRRLVGLGMEDPFLDEGRLDRANAVRENAQMAVGYVIEPQGQDNPEIHLRVHVRFMKTPDFRMLPPEYQLNFIRHVEQTELQLTPQAPPVGPGDPAQQQPGPEMSPAARSPELYPPETGNGFLELAAARRAGG